MGILFFRNVTLHPGQSQSNILKGHGDPVQGSKALTSNRHITEAML
jgi:hypothetical protein